MDHPPINALVERSFDFITQTNFHFTKFQNQKENFVNNIAQPINLQKLINKGYNNPKTESINKEFESIKYKDINFNNFNSTLIDKHRCYYEVKLILNQLFKENGIFDPQVYDFIMIKYHNVVISVFENESTNYGYSMVVDISKIRQEINQIIEEYLILQNEALQIQNYKNLIHQEIKTNLIKVSLVCTGIFVAIFVAIRMS